MKQNIKSLIKWITLIFSRVLVGTKLGQYAYDQITNNAMTRTQEVEHRGLRLRFSVPNGLNKYRASSFSSKEPETLDWIDGIPAGAVFWDIGANVGLYTCYAGVARGCRVFAFEPSVFNLELLARNIFNNNITDKATIVPLPLSDGLALNKLNMTSTVWGGALSTFGQSYGHDGQSIEKVFEFPTVGLSITEAVELLKIPLPDYIKMDVDGIEHLILKGAAFILPRVKGILIEINDNFDEQAVQANRYLKDAGFSLVEKKHADCFDSVDSAARYTFNQIWVNEANRSALNATRKL
jgi:FkbM family methyltransferase